uniref:Uncharacterized protein n=1 Tax=Timema genevievae TaxID=629358 RepID=A0A7R9JYE7_TIMGE|nr:unnamed protein product [Timema genevievae]
MLLHGFIQVGRMMAATERSFIHKNVVTRVVSTVSPLDGSSFGRSFSLVSCRSEGEGRLPSPVRPELAMKSPHGGEHQGIVVTRPQSLLRCLHSFGTTVHSNGRRGDRPRLAEKPVASISPTPTFKDIGGSDRFTVETKHIFKKNESLRLREMEAIASTRHNEQHGTEASPPRRVKRCIGHNVSRPFRRAVDRSRYAVAATTAVHGILAVLSPAPVGVDPAPPWGRCIRPVVSSYARGAPTRGVGATTGRKPWARERDSRHESAHRPQTRPKNIDLSAWRGSRRPWWVCKPRLTELTKLTMLVLVSA